GVQVPITVDGRRLEFRDGSPPSEIRASCEGSTRLGTAHNILDVDPGAVIGLSSVERRDLLRDIHRRVRLELETAPGPDARARFRLFTVPMLLVVDVVDSASKEAVTDESMARAIVSYTALIHTDPRPWDEPAQATRKAERVIEALRAAGAVE